MNPKHNPPSLDTTDPNPTEYESWCREFDVEEIEAINAILWGDHADE